MSRVGSHSGASLMQDDQAAPLGVRSLRVRYVRNDRSFFADSRRPRRAGKERGSA